MLRYIIERCLSKKGGRVDEGGEATLWMRLKIIFNELSLSFFPSLFTESASDEIEDEKVFKRTAFEI